MNRRIDAHYHVWDLAMRDQPWMTGEGMSGEAMAPMARTFGIDEYINQLQSSDFSASVVVQTVNDVAETEELLDLADLTESLAGVVGWVDLAAADVGDQLDRLLARPSGRWLVGIRSLVQYEPDPEWLSRPAVRAGLREVARRGLVNELLVLPNQLRAVHSAVSDVSECRFVLDHLAKPAIASRNWEPWASDLAAVAATGNVCVKISGLVTEAEWSNWSTGDLQPYFDHALAVFGAARLMFGSDWPVCTLAASYQRVVELAEHFIGGLSPAEQAAIMGGNAADVYSLQEAP